ncbi:hypothetical protein BDF20DRAFT_840552 [Mycotypha africana]|uniref:uncharacterized protein n=1 Tax=Mycotypha africana TaxID=64632 RepID=UPI0022FFF7A0|nr:uncharacterized protein BDF20DRAFT_840552 [Mycotypha africana]KAI8967018.1 hypothetical protein BDF20DRAFT_840552 [Mycotypha africana]
MADAQQLYEEDDFNSDIPEEEIDELFEERVEDFSLVDDTPEEYDTIQPALSPASPISINRCIISTMSFFWSVLRAIRPLDYYVHQLCYWILFHPFLFAWYCILKRQNKFPDEWTTFQRCSQCSLWPVYLQQAYRKVLGLSSFIMFAVAVLTSTSSIIRLLGTKQCDTEKMILDDNRGVIMTIRENVPFFRSLHINHHTSESDVNNEPDVEEELSDLSSLLFLLGQKILMLKQQQSLHQLQAKRLADQTLEKYQYFSPILLSKIQEYSTTSSNKSKKSVDEIFSTYISYVMELFDDVLQTDTEKQLLKRLLLKDIEHLRQQKTYRDYLNTMKKEMSYHVSSYHNDYNEDTDQPEVSLPTILNIHGVPIAIDEIRNALWNLKVQQYRKINYASANLGAYVLYPLTSATFELNGQRQRSPWREAIRKLTVWSSFWLLPNSADKTIQNDNHIIKTATMEAEEGKSDSSLCWLMTGQQGNLSIALSEPIRIHRLSITFKLQKERGGDINSDTNRNDYNDWWSAPEDIELFGISNHPILRSKQPSLVQLGKFKYEYYSGSDETQIYELVQTEELSNSRPFHAVMIRVLSNHGNPAYTKICKVGIYGVPIGKYGL